MKDVVKVTKVDETHYEIVRTLTDKVNRQNLEEQLKQLEMQEEALNDQLEAISLNKKTLQDALGIKEEGGEVEGKGKVVNLKEEKKPSPKHKHHTK